MGFLLTNLNEEDILISKKEHEERRLELFKMLLPEMIPEKLKHYNVDNLVGYDLLAKTLASDSPGTGLLDILKGRVPKAKAAGCEVFNQVDGKVTFTELGVISKNLELLYLQLSELLTIQKESNTPLIHIENIITSVAMIFYPAGAHDMKVNLERHSTRGVKSSSETPSKGGKGKAEKSLPVQFLINEIVESVNKNTRLVKITKTLLSHAICDVIEDFASISNNKKMKCLSSFKGHTPSQPTIRRWLSDLDVHEKLAQDKRTTSLIKLVDSIKDDFPIETIKLILKN